MTQKGDKKGLLRWRFRPRDKKDDVDASGQEDGKSPGSDKPRLPVYRELHSGRPLTQRETGAEESEPAEAPSEDVTRQRKPERPRKGVSPGHDLAKDRDFVLVNERFPHIGERIAALWGSAELGLYINELFLDTRGGTRQGFPAEISRALFRLSFRHDQLFPELPDSPEAGDAWEDDEF